MYLCVSGHLFVCYGYRFCLFLRFSIGFWNCSDSVVLFVFCTRLHKWVREGWYKNENIYMQNTNCYINSKRGYGSLVLTLVVSYIWNTRCWRVSTICPLPLPSLLLCEYILFNHFCVISTIVSSFIWIVGALFPSSYWYIKPKCDPFRTMVY